jgi:hypothetical protein
MARGLKSNLEALLAWQSKQETRMRILDPERLSYPEWFAIVLALIVLIVLFTNWLNMTIWNY